MMMSHRLSCASGQWYFRRRSTTRIVVEGILRGRVAQEGRKCSSKRGKRLVDEGSYAWVGVNGAFRRAVGAVLAICDRSLKPKLNWQLMRRSDW